MYSSGEVEKIPGGYLQRLPHTYGGFLYNVVAGVAAASVHRYDQDTGIIKKFISPVGNKKATV